MLRSLLVLGLLGLLRTVGAGRPGREVKAIWDDESAINKTQVENLRQQAWEMFDHGFTHYMKHAFPMDNLLPISCSGRDWQGGLAITLVDSLDALVLLNRRQDVADAVELVRGHLRFDKDIKVHVFETVIRVLGGLLSGHMLLDRNPELAGPPPPPPPPPQAAAPHQQQHQYDHHSGLCTKPEPYNFDRQTCEEQQQQAQQRQSLRPEQSTTELCCTEPEPYSFKSPGPASEPWDGSTGGAAGGADEQQQRQQAPAQQHLAHGNQAPRDEQDEQHEHGRHWMDGHGADEPARPPPQPAEQHEEPQEQEAEQQQQQGFPRAVGLGDAATRSDGAGGAGRPSTSIGGTTAAGGGGGNEASAADGVGVAVPPRSAVLASAAAAVGVETCVASPSPPAEATDAPAAPAAAVVVGALVSSGPVTESATKSAAATALPTTTAPEALPPAAAAGAGTGASAGAEAGPAAGRANGGSAAAVTGAEEPVFVEEGAKATAAPPPPVYDGIFLRKAVQLADLLLPAFDTPSGLPALFVHLKNGPVRDAHNSTCTACAGTLLLEFGLLTALTGNPIYLERAEFAARFMYDRRSRLGLVGGSLNLVNSEWAVKESTIGPGSDSYYEYLLKAYLMFGKHDYLHMFAELYTSTMRWMQIPGTFKGYSFLVDVHMDNGRLARPFVSSLGAFWPGMQALAGQERDAMELHANFTAAWRTFGWMPEMFGIDLSKVHPEDPGYNLRPEHIESTYLLHCLTQDPSYLRVAANIQSTLHTHNRVKCGYTNVNHVDTGEHGDLMESYFLSETAKYLYLLFSSAPGLIDYYVLTTEGHIVPPLHRPAAPDVDRLGAQRRAGRGAQAGAAAGEGGRGQGRERAAAGVGGPGKGPKAAVRAAMDALLAAVEAAAAAVAGQSATAPSAVRELPPLPQPGAADVQQPQQQQQQEQQQRLRATVGGGDTDAAAAAAVAAAAAAIRAVSPSLDGGGVEARATITPAGDARVPPSSSSPAAAAMAEGHRASGPPAAVAWSGTAADEAIRFLSEAVDATGGAGGGSALPAEGSKTPEAVSAFTAASAMPGESAGGQGGGEVERPAPGATTPVEDAVRGAEATAASVGGVDASRPVGGGGGGGGADADSGAGRVVRDSESREWPDAGNDAPASASSESPPAAGSGSGGGGSSGGGGGGGEVTSTTMAADAAGVGPGELEVPHPIPANCLRVCTAPSEQEQAATEARLRAAFPLLPLRRADAELIRHRRCVSCCVVSRHLAEQPPQAEEVRARIMRLPQNSIDEVQPLGQADGSPHNILAQVVCTLKIGRDGAASCNNVRAVTQHDAQHGVPYNAVILQLSAVQEDPAAVAAPPSSGVKGRGAGDNQAPPQGVLDTYILAVVRGGAGGEVSYVFEGMLAQFGPELPDASPRCLQHLLAAPAAALAAGCDGHFLSPPDAPYDVWPASARSGASEAASPAVAAHRATCPAYLQWALLQKAMCGTAVAGGEVECRRVVARGGSDGGGGGEGSGAQRERPMAAGSSGGAVVDRAQAAVAVPPVLPAGTRRPPPGLTGTPAGQSSDLTTGPGGRRRRLGRWQRRPPAQRGRRRRRDAVGSAPLAAAPQLEPEPSPPFPLPTAGTEPQYWEQDQPTGQEPLHPPCPPRPLPPPHQQQKTQQRGEVREGHSGSSTPDPASKPALAAPHGGRRTEQVARDAAAAASAMAPGEEGGGRADVCSRSVETGETGEEERSGVCPGGAAAPSRVPAAGEEHSPGAASPTATEAEAAEAEVEGDLGVAGDPEAYEYGDADVLYDGGWLAESGEVCEAGGEACDGGEGGELADGGGEEVVEGGGARGEEQQEARKPDQGGTEGSPLSSAAGMVAAADGASRGTRTVLPTVEAEAAPATAAATACGPGGGKDAAAVAASAMDVVNWTSTSIAVNWTGWAAESHQLGPCAVDPPVTAALAAAVPLHGCSRPTNPQDLAGAVAVVGRGGCSFVTKVAHMQDAGAAAVIVVNSRHPTELLSMAPDETDHQPNIPAVLIGGRDGSRLLRAVAAAAAPAGAAGGPPLVASLSHLQSSMVSRASLAAAGGSASAGGGGGGGGEGSSAAPGSGTCAARPGGGGGASGAAAGGDGGGGRAPSLSTRLDLLIPGGSQPFLAANVLSRGRSMQQMFEALLEDGRAVALLQQLAQKSARQMVAQMEAWRQAMAAQQRLEQQGQGQQRQQP